MIGTRGTLKYIRTHIHNVPILFCPVCHRVEVHHLAQNEYEILAEYAHGDGAYEVDFTEYVDSKKSVELFENCVNNEDEEPLNVVLNQIDISLDLLTFSKQIGDEVWENQLKKRLQILSQRRNKLRKKNAMGGTK